MKNILLLGKFATYEELMVYLSNICSVWCLIGLLELGLWKPSLSGGIFIFTSEKWKHCSLFENNGLCPEGFNLRYFEIERSSQVQGPGSNDSCCGDQCTDKCKLWWAVERSRYKYCWLWPPFHPRHGVARTQLTRPRTSSPPCWLVLSRSYRHRWGVESWPRLGEISHILFVANVHKGL